MKKSIILLMSFLMLSIFISCDNPDTYDWPDDYCNNTVVSFNTKVETIQDAAAAASDYVNEWARAAKLYMIEVVFTGDQIQRQRGLIHYIFIADDGKTKCQAVATVTVDMQTSSIITLDAWYDVRTFGKRNKNRDLEGWDTINSLYMSNWTLTLNGAFDIVYREIGAGAFSKFENPKVTLRCFSDKWYFYVSKETETWYSADAINIITINPLTKEVTY